MNSRDITIYLDERWCKALETHTGLTMESLLSGQMDALIQELPKDQREQITQEIHQEEQEQAREAEANRRFSVIRVTENGESRCCLVERGMNMCQTALHLRRYLRGELQDPAQFFAGSTPITEQEMAQYAAEKLRGSPRVMGPYDIDLDSGTFFLLDHDKGWRGFQIKDVSTAAYFATRKGSDSWATKKNRFRERLESKELTSIVRPVTIRGDEALPTELICFEDEVSQVDHLLNFYIPVYFNPDQVFGLNVETEENADWLNLYANYDMEQGCICDTLEVYLVRGDSSEVECEYRLTPEEQAAIHAKMDSYCMAQRGLSLEAAREQYLAEEQVPTGQEPPQQAAPILQM